MPILCQDAVWKVMGKPIDEGDDLFASRDFEGAPPAKIVLDIDDEKTVSWSCGHARGLPESRYLVLLAATSSYLCGSERTFDQAVIFPVPATHLGHRLIVDLYDICGEIEIPPHESRTDAIGIDWNPFVFESQDLVNIESTRGNDADLTKAFVVESHADVADKLWSYPGLLLAIGVVS